MLQRKYYSNTTIMLTVMSIFFMSGCTHQVNHSIEKTEHINTTSISIVKDKNLADLLMDSAKTNSSSTVKKLIDNIAHDTNNPETFYALGYLHMQNAQHTKNLHEHDLAIHYFNNALTLVPGNQVVLRALYNIYYDDTLHQYTTDANEKALSIFLQFSDDNRKEMNPPALAQYVATVAQQEKDKLTDKQTLRNILLRGIQQQPFNDNVYIYLAKIYAEDHYFALAIATLKLGADNIKTSVDLYRTLANTYEKWADLNSCSYEHPEYIKQAATYYKLAIAIDPNNQGLHQHLSQNLLDQNLLHIGLNESFIANNLESSQDNLSSIAQNYSMLGLYSQANNFLQQAAAKGFDTSNPLYHEIYMDQGEWQKASESFADYVKHTEKLSVYDLIKSDMIAQQAHQTSQIKNQKIVLGTDWEEKLFNYWTAKTDEASLKKDALTSCEKTEYYFYSGYKNYNAGDINTAKAKFTAAINQNTYRFIERPLARYFLQK